MKAFAHSFRVALLTLLLTAGLATAQDTTDQDPPADEPEITVPVVDDPNTSAAEQMMEEAASTTADAPDYEVWSRVATRAEQALEAGRASDQALESLRAEVDEWRTRFAAARDENKVRITTLRNQIAALPEPPAEGETENETLASQREQLNEQLSQLETPVRAAEVAFARADTIIAEIDDLLRSRQTEELFTIGPSPVNPTHWSEAISDIGDTFHQAWRGTIGSIETDSQKAQFRRALVPVIVLLVIAFVLIVRGRSWVIKAGVRVRSRGEGPARARVEFSDLAGSNDRPAHRPNRRNPRARYVRAHGLARPAHIRADPDGRGEPYRGALARHACLRIAGSRMAGAQSR
jgi:small-conductance mechanosensitive channel